MRSLKSLLGLAAVAALAGGCAAYPYYGDGYNGSRYNGSGYNGYGYNGYGYDAYGPGPGPGPGYYDEPGYYVAPEIGFGFGFSDRDRRDGRDWRGEEHHRRDERH